MPRTSDYTELLGETLLAQVDELCEELKVQLGWPPLGQAMLSPSGARSRERGDAAILADFLTRVGPEMALSIMTAQGVELVDQFGERVVREAMMAAGRAFAAEMGTDGREAYVEQAGGG